MLELINIQPLQIDDEDLAYLKKVCGKVFKEHEFRYEVNGFVTLTKESWANPESFSLHWYEFVVNVLPTFIFAKYSYKWFVENCITPPKNVNGTKTHPIKFMMQHYTV